MSKQLKQTDYKTGKLVRLSGTRQGPGNFLYTAMGIVFAVFSVRLLVFILSIHHELSIFVYVFLLLFLSALIMLTRMLLKRGTESEQLFIDKEILALTTAHIFSRKTKTYPLDNIYKLRFLDEAKYTDHQLKGESFDYLGFQGREKMIQHLNSDGRIAFDYEGRVVCFGKGLFSWDFNELVVTLFETSGRDLRYQEKPAWEDFPL
jgi:hypothetical protein